ncbi:MAG TPA: hypothetical protein VGI66_17575 [Streptosporangiaceae bacterium]|jgi:hypothetical protein
MTLPYSPELAIPGTHELLACGCEFWNQALPGTVVSTAFGASVWSPEDGTEFVIRPCSPDCTYYRYAARRSAEIGHPLQFREE